MLRIAVWDIPPAQFLVSRLQRDASIETVSGPAFACEKWLAEEKVDLALVSTLFVMRDPEPWELVPGVGLASRRYPYARLVLRDGLGDIRRIGFSPQDRQEALLTQIVLKEHYQAAPEFVPYQHEGPEEVLAAQGGVLVTDSSAVPEPETGVILDIGQEWYELTTYPMVWGLFAARQDRLPLDRAEKIHQQIAAVDENREEWISDHSLPNEIADFMREDLFTHLKGPVEGGLQELGQYLFFHGMLEEVPQLPFLIFPEEEETTEYEG